MPLSTRLKLECALKEYPTSLLRQNLVINDIPVMGLDEAQAHFSDASIITTPGNPQTRQAVVEKCLAASFRFETIIHPKIEISRWVEIGTGTTICAGSIITTNIILGQHIQININCTISHDAVIGDYTTLSPGVHIAGNVHTGKRVFFGVGAVVINGTADSPIVIGDDAIIGAGACVTRSVPAGVTVVGVPSKPIKRS